MKVDSLRISKVFSGGGDVLYILPYFQREYAWEKENWKTLLNDVYSIYEVYQSDKEPEHFLGSLVVINDGTRNGTIPAFKLVDGQQRLTTVSLILCALDRIIKHSHPDVSRRIQKLLANLDESDHYYFKLLPTTKYGDRAAYLALIKGEEVPATESKIPQAFEFLHKDLAARIAQNSIDPAKFFITVTNCLQVVFIDLDQQERPYEIFESLNYKGKSLSQADLVRNYIAMRLPESKQEEVFERHWSKIEDLLQEKRQVGRSRLGELTAFLRHYLAMRSGTLCNEEHVYARFRDRIEKEIATHDTFVGEIITLKRFAGYYNCLLRPENEPNSEIKEILTRLNILEISTAYPFLLAMYEAYRQSLLKESDFLEGLQILENYIMRRYLAGEQTNYLNKMFPTLWRELDQTRLGASLRQVLLSKNYPADNKVKQAIHTSELYDNRSQTRQKICLLLDSINRHLSKGSGGYTKLDAAATIEHIFPQTPDQIWKKDVGDQWEQVFRDQLHTLGNLTLVTQEWNSSLSNAPFKDKRAKLANHALRLNSDYFSRPIPHWGKEAIQERAEFLTQQVLDIWPALGDPPIASSSGTRPRSLVVLSETPTITSWRDVAFHTAETISLVVDNFDALAAQMPSYFSKEKFKGASRQLSNGWWLYVNLSGPSVKSFCQRLIALANIAEDEWQLEEE
jgi:uncharacterized protein with ParB-like and HNH nuclease domain